MSEKQAQIEHMAHWWSLFAPPLRPGRDEIGIFDSMLPDLATKRAMVLGSTPELVDLLLRRSAAQVMLIDNFEPTIQAMEILGEQDWSSVDILLSDWLQEVDRLRGALDLVVADNSLLFLEYPRQWQRVIELLGAYMVSGGQVVLRGYFMPAEPFDLDPYLEARLERVAAFNQNDPSVSELRGFAEQVSAFRLGTALEALDDEGVIERKGRNERIDVLKHRLAEVATAPACTEILEAILYQEVGRPGELIPLAMPRWEVVKELFQAAGFSITKDVLVPCEPRADVTRCFTAVKS